MSRLLLKNDKLVVRNGNLVTVEEGGAGSCACCNPNPFATACDELKYYIANPSEIPAFVSVSNLGWTSNGCVSPCSTVVPTGSLTSNVAPTVSAIAITWRRSGVVINDCNGAANTFDIKWELRCFNIGGQGCVGCVRWLFQCWGGLFNASGRANWFDYFLAPGIFGPLSLTQNGSGSFGGYCNPAGPVTVN